MHVVQTAGEPPRSGRAILAIIGWGGNSRTAPRPSVRAYRSGKVVLGAGGTGGLTLVPSGLPLVPSGLPLVPSGLPLVPMLRVGMPSSTLRVLFSALAEAAERPGRHPHAERRDEGLQGPTGTGRDHDLPPSGRYRLGISAPATKLSLPILHI